MKLGARNKKSKHQDRFPHGRLTPAGDLFKLWKLGEREEVRHETEYRPLDREALKDASRALGFRGRDKEEEYTGLIGIRSPQLHKREIKGGVSSSGHNCFWFIDEPVPKRRDAIERLEEAARKGDEPSFLKGLENITWAGRPDTEFIRAIKLAFKAGAFRAALYIASEGVKHHPGNAVLQKYVRVLNPSQPSAAEPIAEANPQANREWLKANAHRYKGKWIAIRNGELLGASKSLESLVEEVGRKFGLAFPSREVLVTLGS
jgi:hypothetical protein